MEIVNVTPFTFAYIGGKVRFPQSTLTFIIKGVFELKTNECAVISDIQLFPTGDEFYPEDENELGGPRYPSDFAYFKPRADLLLVGKYYSP